MAWWLAAAAMTCVAPALGPEASLPLLGLGFGFRVRVLSLGFRVWSLKRFLRGSVEWKLEGFGGLEFGRRG